MEAGVHELTAGYALDALDADERRAYEAHLADCPRCREELAGFWRTAEALAVAATGPEPAPELRERVLAGARAEPQVVVPLDSRQRRTTQVLGAAAAVAAVLALGLGLWGSRLSGELDDTRAALEQQRAAAAVLAEPGSRTVSLRPGAVTGRLVVAPDGRAALVVDGLDRAPAGKTYEVWVVARGTPSPAGLFAGGEETEVVAVQGDVPDGSVVAVTIEDEGGVTVPTTDPIAVSLPV